MTIVSSVVFMELKADDGSDISQHDTVRQRHDHDREHLVQAPDGDVEDRREGDPGEIGHQQPAPRGGRRAGTSAPSPAPAGRARGSRRRRARICCRPKKATLQPRLTASCRAKSVSGPRAVSRSAARQTRQAAIAHQDVERGPDRAEHPVGRIEGRLGERRRTRSSTLVAVTAPPSAPMPRQRPDEQRRGRAGPCRRRARALGSGS